MRLILNRFLALVVVPTALLAAVTSCKKSNNSSSNNNGSAVLSALVNDTAWTNGFPLTATYSVGSYTFTIRGEQFKDGDSTGLGLVILSPISVNQAISSSSGMVDVEYVDAKTQFEYDGGGNGVNAGHSILTVTSYDANGQTIAGTFSGVLYNLSLSTDSVIVTNGKFNTSYTSQ